MSQLALLKMSLSSFLHLDMHHDTSYGASNDIYLLDDSCATNIMNTTSSKAATIMLLSARPERMLQMRRHSLPSVKLSFIILTISTTPPTSSTPTAIISLDGLLSRFSSLDCNTAEHQSHVLKLEFPVGSLLPEGCHLFLEPPKDVSSRCQPPEDRRVSGLLDLDFPIILTANGTSSRSGTAPHSVLLDAVTDLPRLGGSSVLEVASYFEEATNQVVYQYGLTTTTASGFNSSRYFKLDSNQSCILFGLAPKHEWISLLQHLVGRESEHAYYHVRKQLDHQYGYVDAYEEERRWETSWSEAQHSSMKEAFRDRVKSMFPGSAADGRNALQLRLPCEHILQTTTIKLSEMTEEDCRKAKCDECKAPVLRPIDIYGVEIAKESLRCQKQHRKNGHWAELDHVPDGHFRDFNGKALAAAVRAVLTSFAVSPLISPPALCSAGSQYTQSIIQHFEVFFSDGDINLTHRPEELVELLIQDALETATNEKGEALSSAFVLPAYVKFLYAWLCRAVNFLCDRKCVEMKASHLGIHRHGHKLMYNSAVWEPEIKDKKQLAPTEDSTDVDMDALNADMGEMDLEGTSTTRKMLNSMDIEMEQNDTDSEEEV